jgi:DNA polymerase-3 subunit epsilon
MKHYFAPHHFAIIDLETTGGLPNKDGITEVAIFIYDGQTIVDEFTSLINPGCPIPPFVQRLTGITDKMVAQAPKFEEVARRIVEMTDNCIFVAHNSSFDYSFLKHQFRKLGYSYRKNSLCTVQLSRRILPGKTSYSLGKLCKEIGIRIEGRHRASGDALATQQLFALLLENGEADVFEELLTLDTYSLKHHPGIQKETVERLPDATGVYCFHNPAGDIIYVGKSANIRSRVMSYFTGEKNGKSQVLRQAIKDISFEVTGSELVALLRESDLINQHQPPFNTAQKNSSFKFGIFRYYNEQGYLAYAVEELKNNPHEPVARIFSKRQGQRLLEQAVRKYNLCQQICGLYFAEKGCFDHMVGICKGACIGVEPAESYNQRAEKAINFLCFEGDNFFIIDKGRSEEEKAVVHVENGQLVGYGYIEGATPHRNYQILLQAIRPYRINKESRKIISGYLRKKKMEKIIRY